MLGEAALMTVLLGAIVVGQLVASKSTYLLRRNLWLDEIITEMLLVDPDVRHSLRAIIGGLDTNPPAYHLLLRPFRKIIGRRAEVGLRSFSLLAALIALVGLYVNLRQVYGPLIALAAVLAVWTHPLLQRCAFEGRMYAPWLAAVVWFSYLLSRSWGSPADPWVHILLACTAVLTCMLHTLGPLSLVLVLGAHLVFNDFQPWSGDALMWASVGPILFVGWIPTLWKQNFANPVTWVSPATKHNLANLARGVVIPPHVATLLVLGGGFAAFLRVPSPPSPLVGGLADAAALAGLVGLFFMPLALIVLSYTVQPLLNDRYATPVVAGFAPAIAAVISPLSPFWIVLLIGALVTIAASHLQTLRAHYWDKDELTTGLIDAIHRHTGDSPVVFETLHELSVVSRYAGLPSKRYVALDFADEAPESAEVLRVAIRNHARMISMYYSRVTLIPWTAARTWPELYVVPSTVTSLKRGLVELEKHYRGFAVLPLQAGLYRFVARRDVVSPDQDARCATMGGT